MGVGNPMGMGISIQFMMGMGMGMEIKPMGMEIAYSDALDQPLKLKSANRACIHNTNSFTYLCSFIVQFWLENRSILPKLFAVLSEIRM